jgi:hypothetical protein
MGTIIQLGGQGYHVAEGSIGFGIEAASDRAVDSEQPLQVGWLIAKDAFLAQTSIDHPRRLRWPSRSAAPTDAASTYHFLDSIL